MKSIPQAIMTTLLAVAVMGRRVSGFSSRSVVSKHIGRRSFTTIRYYPTRDITTRPVSAVAFSQKRWFTGTQQPTIATRASFTDTDTSVQSQLSSPASEAPTVVLKRSRQSKLFWQGNPLVFTKAVARVKGPANLASLVQVVVEEDTSQDKQRHGNKSGGSQQRQQKTNKQYKKIGWGLYNPHSMYRVRILCHQTLQPKLCQRLSQLTIQDAMAEIVTHQVQVAHQKRLALNLPNPQTSMYRLVNGEGDQLSGLQIDVINDDTIVIQSSAAWCQIYKEIIEEAVQQITPCNNIIWKTAENRLQQDGMTVDDHDINEIEDETPVIALENGIQFQTFPGLQGQKTGVYCDQRHNRHLLAQYCSGKRVLDLCCYHGGFSLTALLQGGAASAIGVDSSGPAIEAAQANAQLNNIDDSQLTFVQSDISRYMQEAFRDHQQFDVVVLDPPKLAPTAAGLDKARRKYHGLNRDAIKLIDGAAGGMLMTCTCSAAMTQKDGGRYFQEMVHGAALAAGRQVTLLQTSGAAPCHVQAPAAWPAGAYLTAALFFVHPVES